MNRCNECINYKVISLGKYGGEKAKCKYSKKCIYRHSQSCLKHFTPKKRDENKNETLFECM